MIDRFFKPDADLDRIVRLLMEQHNIHAVGYALIDDSKVKSVNTITDQNIESAAPLLYQAASLSKSITTYAVVDLVEQHKVQLDARVNDYLQHWKITGPYSNDVTVRYCLNMTSGLCFGDQDTVSSRYLRDEPIPKLSELLSGKQPAKNPPVQVLFEPGTKYHYNGASFTVLQQLIEDVVGQRFEDYMNRNILPRLDMQNSIFQTPLSSEREAQVINGYMNDGTQIKDGWYNIVYAASGGLWTCPKDMASFMLYISKLYTENNEIIKDMLTVGKNTDYGLGVVVDGEGASLNFRKVGYNGGYYNKFIMFPTCGQGIVVMTNSAVGIGLIDELITIVGKQYSWPYSRPDDDEVLIKTPKNQ